MERALEGLPMWGKMVHCWLDNFSKVDLVQFLEKNKLLLLWHLFATYQSISRDKDGFKRTLSGFFVCVQEGGKRYMNIRQILFTYLSSLHLGLFEEEDVVVLKDLEAFIDFIKINAWFVDTDEQQGHTFQLFIKAEEYLDSHYCGNCKKWAECQCAGCKWQNYCNRECQRADRPRHKLVCSPNFKEDSANLMIVKFKEKPHEQIKWAMAKIMGRSCLPKLQNLEFFCDLCQPLLDAL